MTENFKPRKFFKENFSLYHDVEEYFEEVLGLDNVYAAGKVDVALKWREKHREEKLVFLGDTDHDCHVAEAMGADCILIAEGHQSASRLRKAEKFVAVLNTQKEVIAYVSNSNISNDSKGRQNLNNIGKAPLFCTKCRCFFCWCIQKNSNS